MPMPRAIRRISHALTAHVDAQLLMAILLLMGVSLLAIFSGSNQSLARVSSQIVNMLVALGVMYRPHIVNYVEDIVTRNRTMVEPQPLRSLDLKPEHLKVVKDALIGVNTEGTGARAFAGAPYVSAGKTGTAQVIAIKQGEKYVASRIAERYRDHALFIAYAPADAPKIAVAVLVENAGFGAATAAPIARKVMDYYMLGKKATPVKLEELDANAARH